ncbi:MAG: hypothetical protein R2939_00295 [Kofleriaceae bacterium]
MSDKAKEAKAKAEAKARAKAEEAAANDPAARRKRMIIAGVAGLVVVGLGVGGFLYYQRWSAKQERTARATAALSDARAAMAAADAAHWARAIAKGDEALEAVPGDARAEALLAQAHIAAAIDGGLDAERHVTKAKALLASAQAHGASGPDLDKAIALKAIVDDQPDRAVAKLRGLAGSDADAALFLGWAHAKAGQHAEAIAAFDGALKLAPKRDVPALYGRAQAKLASGDLEGARADFGSVLGSDKDHIGAQVGLAAAASPSDLARREGELLALLARADIDKGDPRAVALAWTLAGDDARRGSRYDAARERYRKAQSLLPSSEAPTIGIAEIELRERKFDVAAETIARALTPPPGSVHANLVAADIDLQTGKLDAAGTRLTELMARKDEVTNPAHKARLFVMYGTWLETQPNKEVDALRAYEDAIALGTGFDLRPTIAIGNMYTRMADKIADTDPKGSADLRAKAAAALAPLDARADNDATVALTLGVAYMDTNPAKAEATLQKAVMAQMAKDQDIEARFQLAKAQSKLGKQAEALATLDGAYALDKTRADVGLELALGFERAGRDAEAGRTYLDLLAAEVVSIDQRGRAGRFSPAPASWLDQAREQGQ